MHLKLYNEIHKIYLNFYLKVTTRTNRWRRGVKNGRKFLISQLTKKWERIDLILSKFNSLTRARNLKLREKRKVFLDRIRNQP